MAVISAAEARFYLPELTGTGEDTNLGTLIDRIESAMAEYLGWPPASAGGESDIEDATHTLYVGWGRAQVEVSDDGETLFLPVRPVVSITSIEDDSTWTHDGSTYLVSSDDYTLDGETGTVTLNPNRSWGSFSRAPRDVKVICVAGYATVPAWAKHAAGTWLKHWWDLREVQGKTNLASQGDSAGLRPETMPASVKEILRPHRILLGAA